MKLLYSDILPLGTDEAQETIINCFHQQLEHADKLEIAVGYVSRASLEELDRLVEAHHIKSICLIIGMYYIEGMPEGSYHTAVRLNKKWHDAGTGEIRIVRSFKYHGKLYASIMTMYRSPPSSDLQIWVSSNWTQATGGSTKFHLSQLQQKNARRYLILSYA